AGALAPKAPVQAEGAAVGATIRAGDLYRVLLTIGAATAEVAYTAAAGDNDARVAAALAALINNSNDPDAAAFTAVSDGAQLFIVKRDGAAFTASFTPTQVSAATVTTTSARTYTLDVTGSVAAGESVALKLTVGATVSTY